MSLLQEPGGEWRNKKATVKDALGSVVTQLTANPDITKFSLPAVFLYPYSALELGAYRGLRFADMLFASAEEADPIDRLVQVMAWAMTSSENEEFNKKPFNPVLGEELTSWVEDSTNGPTLFRAEQVEHHPPVSAFIMRNEKLDVTFVCNVEFAVSFHGNSVTISTRGYGEIRFGKLGETYTISKYIPDLKIESCLFGTRRQCWRGTWEIRCEQTGLVGTLNFSEAKKSGGWFTGSTQFINEVSGFVWRHGDDAKAPLATMSGIAGERLVLERSQKADRVVLDFATLSDKTQRLHFVPANLCPPNDSLRVWHKVKQQILLDDMKRADRAKSRVEDHHRKLKKEREATGEKFVPKYFVFEAERERWVPTAEALSFATPDDSTGMGSNNNTMETFDDMSATWTQTQMSEFGGGLASDSE